MTTYYSPSVPYYIDVKLLAQVVYDVFSEYAPRVSGNMASHIDYEVTGDRIFFWDECPYASYQDTLVSKKGNKALYYGWWSEELPRVFEHTLAEFERISKESDKIITHLK